MVLENSPASRIRIYPNPAKDRLNIAVPNEISKCVVEIFGTDGAILKTKTMETATGQIDISDLSPGVLSVKVSWDGGSFVGKVVKY